MSYPILYKSNENNFDHLGLGVLKDAVSCMITEERNGIFELEMKYHINGTLFSEIKNDRLIKADAGNFLKNQRFKIIRITKPIDGIATVYAEHISYLSQDLALKPSVQFAGSALSALHTWGQNIVDQHPFTVWSNILTTASGEWKINEVQNARSALGGVRGSILDNYGGEYLFDNYNIRLYGNRGEDKGSLLAYGKNIIDLVQEEEIANTYTSVYPYSITQKEGTGEDVLTTLPEYFVDSEHVNKYARRKILTVDFSEEEISNVTQLRNRANQYITANEIGIPKVNLKVKYIDLTKTLDYKDLKMVEEIDLCDIVTVYFSELGIETKAKVIKTVWDVLLDRYESLEIGEARYTFSEGIGTVVDDKVSAPLSAVERATKLITSAIGGYVLKREGELLIMDTEDPMTAAKVWRWNLNGLGYSKTGINGPYELAMTMDGHFVADFMTTGVLTSILIQSNNYVPNVSGCRFDLTGGTYDSRFLKWDTQGNVTLDGGLIRSKNYSFTSGNFSNAGSLINLTNGVFLTPNFGINAAGNAFFKGELQAPSGTIGGCSIGTDGIYSYTSAAVGFGLWGSTAHANIAIHAGANGSNIGGAPFRVYHSGHVELEDVTMNGGSDSGVTCKIHDISNQYWTDLFGSGIQLRRNGYAPVLSMNYTGLTAFSDINNQSIYSAINGGFVSSMANGSGYTMSPSGVSPTSLAELKDNIVMQDSLLVDVMNTDVYEFEYKGLIKEGIRYKKYGFIIGEGYHTTDKVLAENKQGVELYSSIGVLWGGVKELVGIVNGLEERIGVLENG